MPHREPLPLYSPIAKPPADVAGRFPKLLISDDWSRALAGLSDSVEASARRLADAIALTGQEASIVATPIFTGAMSPGMYEVSIVAEITRAAATSSSLDVSIGFTSRGQSKSFSLPTITGNTVTTIDHVTRPIRIDAPGPVTYSTTYGSVGSPSMQYALSISLSRLALEEA